jgi:hypothetical protein
VLGLRRWHRLISGPDVAYAIVCFPGQHMYVEVGHCLLGGGAS